MQIAALLSFLLGLLFVADAARDEYRGVATTRAPNRLRQQQTVRRADNPAEFRALLTYEWFRGPLVLLAGGVFFSLHRRAERQDPFAPDPPEA